MNRFPIYAFGYTGRQPSTIAAGLEAVNGLLLDIRFSPRSRAPMWNRKSLEATLGERYKWAGDTLGNRLYRSDDIAIVDLERGLDMVTALTLACPVALMCVCRDLAGCHRAVITRALALKGFEVFHHLPEGGAHGPESHQP